MPTKADKKQQKSLSIEQLNAIDLLVMGKSDREVAEAVGVHRTTVTGWRLYNPHFQAALNRRRKEVFGAAVDRFRSLLQKALDVVEGALEEGDPKIAMEVLKMAGFGEMDIGMIGSDDPEEIIAKEAEKEAFSIPVGDWNKQSVLEKLKKREKELMELAEV